MNTRRDEPEDVHELPAPAAPNLPLATEAVEIDDDCVGSRWVSQNETQLARLIAIIAMGQAAYAADILSKLLPASPAFSTESLRTEAIIRLTVQEERQEPRQGYPRWQRDGFMFEAISWIAARQEYGERALVLDPHVKATAQGIDGLLLRLSKDKTKIVSATILEDKCSDDPRDTFLQRVIPAFLEHHTGKRGAEVVAAATVLLRMAGFGNTAAATVAAVVTNRKKRGYRAAFALTEEYDSLEQRKKLFKDYDSLNDIGQAQRVGASFIVTGELRVWFDHLAEQAIAFLAELEVKDADV